MDRCPVCQSGTLRDAKLEKWLEHGSRGWLFQNVPGLVCDQCGEVVWGSEAIQKLVGMVSGRFRAQPTGSAYFPLLDLDRMRTFVSDGTQGAPIEISGTETNLPFRYVTTGVGPDLPPASLEAVSSSG